MTPRGHAALSAELKQLKGFERPSVVDAIRVAREHGDLSENAEYEAAKDRQGMIEARIRMIEDRLARAEVVETSGQELDRVRFATKVVLEDLDSGEEVTYTIVGEDEADVSQGLLSVTSPVARALIGKAVDDQVAVRVPAGTREYEVREILPFRDMSDPVEHTKILIVGSGPAGYTAAIYAARAELAPVVVAGTAFGGQLMLTTDVENYPGFPDGVAGPDLMESLQRQAERFGSRVLMEDALEIDFESRPFRVRTDGRSFTADALILATGASARWLGLDSEQKFMNRGVSACATCDGALYRGKPMGVVGGGDTAMEEALFLTRFATLVHVIHRRDELRASRIMQDRAFGNPKIRLVWDSTVEEVLGDDSGVTGVRIKNAKTGDVSTLDVEALFIAIGHRPNTDLFKGAITTGPNGYVQAEPGSTRTNVEGVFACGDVIDPTYRQAVTAAGTGCMAALDAERWLAATE